MFTPQVGDRVRLNPGGVARFKRQIRGTVDSIDPNDQAAVKVKIDAASARVPVVRTISLRDLEADHG